MLNFIGTGSAFNTELGNNSACIKSGKSLLLIDCGGTIFHRLKKRKLLEGLDNLYIIITHTHPDHVGSLGEVIFYAYYILKTKVQLFFPDEKHIKNFLYAIGVKEEQYEFSSFNKNIIEDKFIKKISFEFLPVTHVNTITSYGLLINFSDKTIYYSGDSNNLDGEILTKFLNSQIQYIYQDTSGLDYQGNGHLYFGRLCELIPLNCRKRVFCMHLDGKISEDTIIQHGFNIIHS